MHTSGTSERFQVIVVGAGQAGLSVGYFLARRGLSFVILDAHARVGDAWRQRWDSMRLFTPAKYDGLVGMPFPAAEFSFPTKDEMADYLEQYATRLGLAVRTNMKVERLSRVGSRYIVEAGEGQFEADHVVVAMASFQAPRAPEFAGSLSPHIRQMHSGAYRNPSQLLPGDVLVVGAANSGADIALDVVRSHRTYLAGRHPGSIPFRIEGRPARALLPFLFRVVFHRILTVDTPIGRRIRPAMLSKGMPLIRVKPADLTAAGVERAPRVTGVADGKPQLADGRVLDVANVIWCTGFHPGLSWVDLPIRGLAAGEPEQVRGVVPGEPGLYFVGLTFLYSASSTMIHGVARDAERIADAITARIAAARPDTAPAQAVAAVG
jgi:putative flavoprotein involved in K+ transport